MAEESAYVVRFNPVSSKVRSQWVITTPDGTTRSAQTLQQAVDLTKRLSTGDRMAPMVDVIWYDREGNKQGHVRGFVWRKAGEGEYG